jgi:hypothetical protein
MRDDFTVDVKRSLAARVGHLCSNPDCRALTSGPQDDPIGTVNLGVAAHITGASLAGPRFDSALTPELRRGIANGIWLCQNCGKLIDSDLTRFTESLLRAWKLTAEDHARYSLGRTAGVADLERRPQLELHLEIEKIGPDVYTQVPVRYFLLGLKNVGPAVAKFPGIRFNRSTGLGVDPFGIDGSYGTGLPSIPSQREWITFRGGNDHVIHSNETLVITKLTQAGENRGVDGISVREYPQLHTLSGPTHHRWEFKAITFRCDMSAEGFPTVVAEMDFRSDSVVWPRR